MVGTWVADGTKYSGVHSNTCGGSTDTSRYSYMDARQTSMD